jgi:hypothetical protein
MAKCYQCGNTVGDLSKRSRCVDCEYERSIFNEAENERLRQRVETLEGALMASREVHVDAWSLLMRQEVDSALLDKRDAAFRLIEATLAPQEGE